MDLTTEYMGLHLEHPFIAGASPLTDRIHSIKEIEKTGAAIILPSLFEEEVRQEQFRQVQDVEAAEETFPEALTYHPNEDEYRSIGPGRYMERIQEIKNEVDVPVIASINAVSPGTWTGYAKGCEDAGADGLELNYYFLSMDPQEDCRVVEDRLLTILQEVRNAVSIPVAVKLSPFFSALPHLVSRLEEAGAAGLVLFNRFYQPDIDPNELELKPELHLSEPSELLLRIRWIGILWGMTSLSLAVTGGVHTSLDGIKSIMAGASGVQVVSTLLKNGPGHLIQLKEGLADWMSENGYSSLKEMRGSMSLARVTDPLDYERAQYMRVLKGGMKYV
ncbi:MAG: dihydroorotate dehydrogenase-like protein [Desulfovibrionales bacterium]